MCQLRTGLNVLRGEVLLWLLTRTGCQCDGECGPRPSCCCWPLRGSSARRHTKTDPKLIGAEVLINHNLSPHSFVCGAGTGAVSPVSAGTCRVLIHTLSDWVQLVALRLAHSLWRTEQESSLQCNVFSTGHTASTAWLPLRGCGNLETWICLDEVIILVFSSPV